MDHATDKLTPREKEVLELVARGMTNAEIAAELHIAVATVKDHLTTIFWKLRVTNRTQAVMVFSGFRVQQPDG